MDVETLGRSLETLLEASVEIAGTSVRLMRGSFGCKDPSGWQCLHSFRPQDHPLLLHRHLRVKHAKFMSCWTGWY